MLRGEFRRIRRHIMKTDEHVKIEMDDVVEIDDDNDVVINNDSTTNIVNNSFDENVNIEARCEPQKPDVKTSRYGRIIRAPKKLDL